MFSDTGPSCRRSNHQGSEPLGVEPLSVRTSGGRAIVGRDHRSSSHRRCDVNKRQGRFGGRKNDRLIGKKPPNPVGTEEENQGRKVLVVVQSSRINLPSRPVVRGVITLHSQSTLRPVVRRVMTLHLQFTSRPVVRRITPFAIHITARVTPGRLHPTTSSQAESPCYYSPSTWRILVAPSRPVDSN